MMVSVQALDARALRRLVPLFLLLEILPGRHAAAMDAQPATVSAPAPVPDVEPDPAPLSEPAAPAPTAPNPTPPTVPIVRASAPHPTVSLVETYLERAAHYFKTQEYDRAADELKKAYLIKPKPLFLFNTAQALRRGGRIREALATYQEFLQKDPSTQLKAETDGYIGDLKAILAEQEHVELARQALVSEKQTTAQTKTALFDERQRAERERKKPIYKRGGFWVGMAAIAVAVGAGVALAVLIPRDPATDGGIINLNLPLMRF